MDGTKNATGEATSRYAGTELYLEQAARVPESQRRAEYEVYMGRIRRFHPLAPGSSILEVGVGTGWFLVMAAEDGLNVHGLEINPVNRRWALDLAGAAGVNLEITLGSVEDADLGEELFDAVVAMSVFEHVRDFRAGLRNVHSALKPGGVLYFYSSNRFSPISGEYRLPFYGWLSDRARYRLRVALQGESIMGSSGIDFNQFTYPQLEREFRAAGFSRAIDQFSFVDVDDLAQPAAWKRGVVRAYQRVPVLRHAVRTFAGGTGFVCVK